MVDIRELEVEGTPLNNVAILVMIAIVWLFILLIAAAWNKLTSPRKPDDDGVDSPRVLRYDDRMLVWDGIPIVVDKSTANLYT